jgi:PAS domain S-box-containing protein
MTPEKLSSSYSSDFRLEDGPQESECGARLSEKPRNRMEQNAYRFRLLVESARDYAMFTLNAAGQVDSWNPGAERILCYAEDEILGQSGDIIFTPEDRTRGAPDQERQTARAEGKAEDERWHVRKDGSRFWASGVMTVLTDDAGSFIGFAKILRDLTERRQHEEALRQARDELEQRVAERTAELTTVNEQRHELLRRIVNAQEAERARISRELHDVTGQIVTALLLGLGSLKAEPLSANASQTVQTLFALAQELAEQSHRLSFALRPTALDDLGLVLALHNHVEQWSQWNNLPVDFQAIGFDGEHHRLPGDIETGIYRIVQEALTNISRHASDGMDRTNQVSLLLQCGPTQVQAIIEDDGVGFDVAAVQSVSPDKRRLGLFGMEERASLMGGTLAIESAPGQGTTVLLRVPLNDGQRSE